MSTQTVQSSKRGNAVKRSVSLPESLASAAEDRATAEGRTLSNYIQRLIQQDVDAHPDTAALPEQSAK